MFESDVFEFQCVKCNLLVQMFITRFKYNVFTILQIQNFEIESRNTLLHQI